MHVEDFHQHGIQRTFPFPIYFELKSQTPHPGARTKTLLVCSPLTLQAQMIQDSKKQNISINIDCEKGNYTTSSSCISSDKTITFKTLFIDTTSNIYTCAKLKYISFTAAIPVCKTSGHCIDIPGGLQV